MTRWGVLLIILGVGSLLLPALNIQFTLMSILDDYQPIAGIVVAAIGAVLVVLAMQAKRAKAPPSA